MGYLLYKLLTNGVFAEQLWFKIKMFLVIAVVLNGSALGRRTGVQIRKTVVAETGNTVKLAMLKRRLLLFHLVQLILFLVIFVLGVFKFN